MTRPYFFPREKAFWVYHSSVMLLSTLLQVLIIVLWREEKAYGSVAAAAWLPLFTLAVLLFRYFYKVRQWQRVGAARLIPAVLLYGLVMGALVALAMLALVTPFFWGRIVANPEVLSHRLTPAALLLQVMIGNALQNQLMISAWIFIYLSITSSGRVRAAELHNLRLQNSLKEAQLSSLANQLHPHFLFNALNNIRFMMHESTRDADTMITSLSEMLRYSIESSQCEKVALRAELDIIERYLAIVRIQMEARLRLSMAVPAALHATLLPPMMLHMLVENAVKHGIDQLQAGGALHIEAHDGGSQLVFSVRNDMPPAATGSAAAGTAIGLRNIEQRLRLLYGEQASLTVAREAGQFIATLTLPKEFAA